MTHLVMLVVGVFLMTPTLLARNVYVNGTDISSARHQLMENVNVRIDGDGNLFIEAPHYQVNEESTYIPLRRNVSDARPEHRPGGIMPPQLTKAGSDRGEPEGDAPATMRPPPAPAAPAAQPAAQPGAPAAQGAPAAGKEPPMSESPAAPLVGKEGSKQPSK